MDFTEEFPFAFILGGTVEDSITVFDDYFFNEKGSGTDLEGFLATNTAGVEEEWKIVCLIEEGRCVTARIDFTDNNGCTFLGVPIGPESSLRAEEVAAVLKERGEDVIAQDNDLVLPDYFITVEPRENICYWDKAYWSPAAFLEETVEPH